MRGGGAWGGNAFLITQAQMAKLFDKGRSTIAEHIQNICKENELDEEVVCRDFRLTSEHGVMI